MNSKPEAALHGPECGRERRGRRRLFDFPRCLKHALHACSWLLWLALLTPEAGAATAETSAGPATEGPILAGSHPYLYFTAAQVAKLQARLPQEKSSSDAWDAIRARADAALGKAGAGSDEIEPLALTFRMTRDKRYADRLRDLLLREVRRANWGEADLLHRDPVWHAGLGLARTLYTVALGYDSVADALTATERSEISHGIVELGVLPTLNDWVLGDKRIHSLDTMGHNWWSACVFVAGIGALAVLDDEPRARGWLERISAGSVEWFDYAGSILENKPATFDPAGGFYESVNYASFAMSQYLLFRLAWTNALGGPPPPAIPSLEHTGDFFLNASYPNTGPMMTLNFGDGNLHVDGSRPVALLWANGFRKPEYAWYLNETKKLSYREGLDRSTPLGLLYYPTDAELAAAPVTPPLPPSTDYTAMGWAMLRDSWAKNSTFLGVRAGYTWNHSHADTGSFLLFHRGEYIVIDSGNPNYARPEYDSYYRQSPAHNVVLFNGEAENPEDTYFGSKFPGSVSSLIVAGDLRYILADATGPTSKNFVRNYRHFLWIGDVILIIDDVEAFHPGQFEWLLHYAGKAVRRGLDLTVTQNAASIIVRPLFPEPFPDAGLPTDYPEKMRLVEKTGLKDHEPDVKDSYYALVPAELTRRTKFITAITLVTEANQAALPSLERLEGTNLEGVRIRQGGVTTDVRLNLLADNRIRHRNANTEYNGWETDAYLTALTYPNGANPADPEAVTRYFIADGSYLRREHTVLLDSLSKVYTTWQTAAPGRLDVVLSGQPVMHVRIHAAQPPAEVRVNGQVATSQYEAESQDVLISRHAP